MKVVDFLIVGGGYAGTFLAHHLLQSHASFLLFTDNSRGASQVSAGMVNPAVLKKFTTFWLAQEQIDLLIEVCREIESYTGENYLIPESVHRIFHDENEQQLWLKKAEKEDLQPFLNPDFKSFPVILNPYKTGEVMQSCRLNVQSFFSGVHFYFIYRGFLANEKFDYNQIDLVKKTYKDISFSKIIFCEGMGVKENPFFKEIEVHPNKGHHLNVKLSKSLNFKATVKKKHFLFPLEDNQYYYGGTYDRDQTEEGIDERAVEQLKAGLREFYPHDFEVAEIHYGFRPTVKDRRPIIGSHKKFDFMYVFNGLGARGVLNGCYFGKELSNHLLHGKDLPEEVRIERFYK